MGRYQKNQPRRPGYLTVTEVKSRWQVSPQTVLHMIREGTLTGEHVNDRYYVTEESVVFAEQNGRQPIAQPRARRIPGSTFAAAFDMLDRFANTNEIVVKLKITPDDVDRIYKEYIRSDPHQRYLDKTKADKRKRSE